MNLREVIKKIRQIEIRTNRLVTEALGGHYHSVFKGQGMNFDEVREYQPGDEVRAIDWNVTARMNHPFIKKFVEERELTLMLVVDISRSMLFGSTEQSKRELAAEIGSVLAFSAIRNHDKVGLILFTNQVEKFIPPRKGKKHVLRVIRDIYIYEGIRPGGDLCAALDFLNRVTSRRAIVVVISDFLLPPNGGASGNWLNALRQARRRHDVVCVPLNDPRELELPNVGRVIQEDLETGENIEINTGDARVRADFARRQQNRIENLRRDFRTARVDSIFLQTGSPYEAALSRFFKTREKKRLRG